MQEWFGESGPGEGLPDLKGVVFYQWFQLGRFGFSLRSKAEEVGKKASQINEMGAKSIQNEAWGTPWGGRGVKAAAGGEGTQKLYIFDAHWIAFGAFSVPLMPKWAPFWAPLDFEGVPN